MTHCVFRIGHLGLVFFALAHIASSADVAHDLHIPNTDDLGILVSRRLQLAR